MVAGDGPKPFAERGRERNDDRNHHDPQGQRTRKTRRTHPLLHLAARPQVERRGEQHRVGRGGGRRAGGAGALPREIQAHDGRLGLLGRILPRAGLRPRRQHQPALRGPDAGQGVAARLRAGHRHQKSDRRKPHGRSARDRRRRRPDRRDAGAAHRVGGRRAVRIRRIRGSGRRFTGNRRTRSWRSTPRPKRIPGSASPRSAISTRRRRSNSRPAISAS